MYNLDFGTKIQKSYAFIIKSSKIVLRPIFFYINGKLLEGTTSFFIKSLLRARQMIKKAPQLHTKNIQINLKLYT